jgi:hypothetical protein
MSLPSGTSPSNHAPSWKTMARLLRVIELLSSKGGTNTQEIAAAIGLNNDRDVSRTILPALRELGLRVHEPDLDTKGVSHRYWLDRDAVRTVRIGIPKSEQMLLEPILEPDEWMLLSFLLNSGGRLTQRPELQAVMSRLRGKLAEVLQDVSINQQQAEFARMFNRLEPVFEYLGTGRKLYPDDIWETTVNPLVEALARQNICTVVYHSFHSASVKTMEILPLRLVEHEGSLYMLSQSAKYRDKVLPLEIGRFKSVVVQDASFELPDIDLDAQLASTFSLFLDEPKKYRIRFSQVVAKHIRESQWTPGQNIIDEASGDIVLEMETSGYPDVKHWVLSWGADAEVLEPLELRDDIINSLKQSLAGYEGATLPG